jgi:Tol biopolymer transport system component
MATSWSPDGQEILFVWINDHRWDVYRVYADEPRFVNLTEE